MSATKQAKAYASNVERQRLEEQRTGEADWLHWGPYLSERQWGTVREDYSHSGDAWNHLSHDQARSRAYRWGEDGLAGISDVRQRLCFSVALWNGEDAILKERLFGLTNTEGNHGEDAKEYYYYLDNTPTHSYMRYLYKYPMHAFPYDELLRVNRDRSRHEFEYELIDTGVFDRDEYFDVFVEYAKASPEELFIRIKAFNRSHSASTLHVLPTVWFRNTWHDDPDAMHPILYAVDGNTAIARHDALGEYYVYCDGHPQLLFCENEDHSPSDDGNHRYWTDGINNAVVLHDESAANDSRGSKLGARYEFVVPPGESCTVRLCMRPMPPTASLKESFAARCDNVIQQRRREADVFYKSLMPSTLDVDQRAVIRQSVAGLLWSKQYYEFDVARWIQQHGGSIPSPNVTRDGNWFHLRSHDIISMPDKWEYPWFAAWDLAFHAVALCAVDPEFAKQQLALMLDNLYLHPNGQMPAYEWEFGDVNPPVHAWATIFVYNVEKERIGVGDLQFLKRSFHKLLLNFTWWVNRKDSAGRNIFEGGFLGLDNIGVFDRSAPLPTEGHLEQADGTAWMALYCQNMLQIALELAADDETYEDLAAKFVEHFLWIVTAMHRLDGSGIGMWDEEDGFFYDVLRLPDGSGQRLKVRSMVGLLSVAAATVFDLDTLQRFPELVARVRDFAEHQPDILNHISDTQRRGQLGRIHLAVLDEHKLRRVLKTMLDETEFLSPYGIRALSRYHLEHPYVYYVGNDAHEVAYRPAESDTAMFGGNSNWRGPVWFPVNAILVRGLLNLHLFYGNDFKVECPTGSGKMMNLFEVSQEISRRLTSIFLRDGNGNRPVFGGTEKFQQDPHWRDHLLFYEYFHGDNGAGLGASHQTGWTGLVALLTIIAEAQPDSPILGRNQPPRKRSMSTRSPEVVGSATSPTST